MRVIVYGGKGWIGQKLVNMLHDHCVRVSEYRLDNLDDIEKEISEFSPTHIACVIGRTHGIYRGTKYTTIDYLEQPGVIRENVRDNLFCPIALAILSQKYNAHLMYMGTGCIFKYTKPIDTDEKQQQFTEDDKPNFFGSSYSVVKGYTDQLMHLFDNVLNILIRMPITDEYNPRNFITKITNYEYICSIPNSMSVLDELLPCVVKMMDNKTSGTINLTNPGTITHNEILSMYREIIDNNFVWKNFSTDEQRKILDADRSNNHLDTRKLEEMFPSVKHIRDSVYDVLIRMKNRSN